MSNIKNTTHQPRISSPFQQNQPASCCQQSLLHAVCVILAIGSVIAIALSVAPASWFNQSWVQAGMLTTRTIVLIVGGTTACSIAALYAIRYSLKSRQDVIEQGRDTPSPVSQEKEALSSHPVETVAPQAETHGQTTPGALPVENHEAPAANPVQLVDPLPLNFTDSHGIRAYGLNAYTHEEIDTKGHTKESPLPNADITKMFGDTFDPKKYAWVYTVPGLTYEDVITESERQIPQQQLLGNFSPKEEVSMHLTKMQPGWRLICLEMYGNEQRHLESSSLLTKNAQCQACQSFFLSRTRLTPADANSKGENGTPNKPDDTYDHFASIKFGEKKPRLPYVIEALLIERLNILPQQRPEIVKHLGNIYVVCQEKERITNFTTGLKFEHKFMRIVHGSYNKLQMIEGLHRGSQGFEVFLEKILKSAEQRSFPVIVRFDGQFVGHVGRILVIDFDVT